MGILDFINKIPHSNSINKKVEVNPSDFKIILDTIQNNVFQFLKPLGFKKKGRTFNRETEKGLYQVINFQSGQFPPGSNYEIPGFRENLYGKFTLNMGVCVSELYDIKFYNKPKTFFQEYDCQIRKRLSKLLSGKDNWWNLNDDLNITTDDLILGLQTKGLGWLDLFDTREKICQNLGIQPEIVCSTAKLYIALIIFQTDKINGSRLINEYYQTLDNKPHKEYVINLAKQLDIEITNY